MTTKKTVTFCMAALLVAAVQMTASGSGTIPGTNIQYDHYLTQTDSGAASLTTGYKTQNWSDSYKIAEGDEKAESLKFYVISSGTIDRKTGKPSTDTNHTVKAGAEAYAKLFYEDVKNRNLAIAELFN